MSGTALSHGVCVQCIRNCHTVGQSSYRFAFLPAVLGGFQFSIFVALASLLMTCILFPTRIPFYVKRFPSFSSSLTTGLLTINAGSFPSFDDDTCIPQGHFCWVGVEFWVDSLLWVLYCSVPYPLSATVFTEKSVVIAIVFLLYIICFLWLVLRFFSLCHVFSLLVVWFYSWV